MPFVTLHYLETTGDESILDEIVPFIESPLLREDEHERYEQPSISEQSASLVEHCRRALQHGLRVGKRGLPLMARRLRGSADKQTEINDSIDLVEDGQRHDVMLEFRWAAGQTFVA